MTTPAPPLLPNRHIRTAAGRRRAGRFAAGAGDPLAADLLAAHHAAVGLVPGARVWWVDRVSLR